MYIYIKPKIILAQLTVNLNLSIIIIRNSCTYCIDEKATEISNTFGT